MSLSDTLAQPPGARSTCSVCRTLTTLAGADLEAFTTALHNPHWPATALAEVLRGEGHSVAEKAIRNHRNGRCRGSR